VFYQEKVKKNPGNDYDFTRHEEKKNVKIKMLLVIVDRNFAAK